MSKIYQITGKQISFRVNEDEKAEINALSAQLQEEFGVKFNNAKEMVFAIIQKLKQGNTEAPHQEVEVVEVLPPALAEQFSSIKESLFEGEDMTEQQMLDTLITIVNTPAPAVEIPVETIKEVERPLKADEILLELTPEQHTVLEKIARWRAYNNKDPERLTDGALIKRMVFNRGTLTNDHGAFETGIRNKHLK